MKAAILYGDRDIRIGDAPDPSSSPTKCWSTGYAGICGTDLHIYRGEFHGRVKFPAIQGHEFGGVIDEVGKDVKGFKAGDRVVVDPIISCHQLPGLPDRPHQRLPHAQAAGRRPGRRLRAIRRRAGEPASSCCRTSIPMTYAPMVEMYRPGLPRPAARPGAAGRDRRYPRRGQAGPLVLDVLCHSAAVAGLIVAPTADLPAGASRKKLGATTTIDIEHRRPGGACAWRSRRRAASIA